MVKVNGTVELEPGRRVEPAVDQVTVRGRPLPGPSTLRYLLVHKPIGMITTLHDPEGRPTVRQLLPPGPRLFPVGRLDADTSGLLLVTNDGELAHRLMHPRHGVEKRYRVLLDRLPSPHELARLRAGTPIEPGITSGPADVRIKAVRSSRAIIEIRIHEGRYRQVRRMCESVGLTVKALHRFGYGPLHIGKLPRGGVRPLTGFELRRLKAASMRPPGPAPQRPLGPRPGTGPVLGTRPVPTGRPEGARRSAEGGLARASARPARRPQERASRGEPRERRGPGAGSRRTGVDSRRGGEARSWPRAAGPARGRAKSRAARPDSRRGGEARPWPRAAGPERGRGPSRMTRPDARRGSEARPWARTAGPERGRGPSRAARPDSRREGEARPWPRTTGPERGRGSGPRQARPDSRRGGEARSWPRASGPEGGPRSRERSPWVRGGVSRSAGGRPPERRPRPGGPPKMGERASRAGSPRAGGGRRAGRPFAGPVGRPRSKRSARH
jgi:23S rRNA pseudouridine2605 synthase